MKTKKYRPSIFLKAAKLIEDGKKFYCCLALESVFVSSGEVLLFSKLYEPENHKGFWFTGESLEALRIKRIKALKRTARIASKLNNGKLKWKDL